MSMKTVKSADQATSWTWYHPSSFLVVMVMTMSASLLSFSYPRSRIAELNGKLSPTYAQSAVVYMLNNILMSLLEIVLPSFMLLMNHDGGISQTRAKKRDARPNCTLRAYLLAVLVVFCLVDIGEANWFGPPRRSLINKAKLGGVSGPLVRVVYH